MALESANAHFKEPGNYGKVILYSRMAKLNNTALAFTPAAARNAARARLQFGYGRLPARDDRLRTLSGQNLCGKTRHTERSFRFHSQVVILWCRERGSNPHEE